MAKLNSDDLKAIKNLMEVAIEEAVEKKQLVTNDSIGNLPTKDEFYGKMDELMGELKTIREEVAVLGHQVSDHDDRLEKLESDQDTSSH